MISSTIQNKIIKETRNFMAEKYRNQLREKRNDFKLIGITGTNGKTTSSWLIHQALNLLSNNAAYLGTIGYFINTKFVFDPKITTPDFTLLYKLYDKCIESNIKAFSIECSAQGLRDGRLEKMEFDYVCFTNLTLDHLDEFVAMENYENAKQNLFKYPSDKKVVAVINGDDPKYKDFCFDKNKNILYGEKQHNDFIIEDCKLYPDSSEFTVSYQNKKYNVKLSLPGKYNIWNYMNAFIILHDMGYSFEEIINI